MHSAHEFLSAITVVLCVAAVTTIVFQRLHQPVVLGYLIAGLIIGPHVPIPLVADPVVVRTLSELGMILLMFSLGLEFSLRKLFKVGPTAGLTAVIQCSLMIWLGFVVGRAFGWTPLESIFTGALIAISSTTIIARAFDEQKISGKLRELVVGVLIVEDLIAILLMATLTALSTPSGLSPGALALAVGRLVAFLVGLIAIGLLVVPRAVRALNRLERPETTLVASLGFCFAVALISNYFGYSVALGAFLAGSLVAESGEEKQIEKLVQPVRDVFAAIFFVSVGMLIDPALIARYWGAIAVLTGVVVGGKILSVALGAFLTGAGPRTSIQAGLSLAQIGEFSFIIAGLGISLNATGDFLYPVAVAVSALTTLSTPWLIRSSGPVASWVDHKLPQPLQTFAALYGSWVQRLREARAQAPAARPGRLIRLLLLDAALLTGLIIGTSIAQSRVSAYVQSVGGISLSLSRMLVLGLACALAIPFCVGIVSISRRLGSLLAELAFPQNGAGLDLAAAVRRALLVTLQLAIVLLLGIPLVAITQPFVPGFPLAAALLLLLIALSIAFWRSAASLQGHVRAGAQIIVEVLAAQSRTRGPEDEVLAEVHRLLPGLGEPVAITLEPDSPAVGKTLAELNLRGSTGATVLAIRQRDQAEVLLPTAQNMLHEGDVLALAGAGDAIDAARAVLLPNGRPLAADRGIPQQKGRSK
jgi:CPA2 family monovalent cation:H+ antiporter-2